MRLKIILITILIILLMAAFGSGFKQTLVKGLVGGVSDYSCSEGGFCNRCIIDGEVCDCGRESCLCGETVVDPSECRLLQT